MVAKTEKKDSKPKRRSQHQATVGERLRAERLAQKLKLEDVIAETHIRKVQLVAIEEGNIDALPGITYAVGFIRSYANFLGLSGVDFAHDFKLEQGYAAAPQKLSFPEPIAENRLPDLMTVGIAAFLAIMLLVGWAVYSNMSDGDVEIVERVPEVSLTQQAVVEPPSDVTLSQVKKEEIVKVELEKEEMPVLKNVQEMPSKTALESLVEDVVIQEKPLEKPVVVKKPVNTPVAKVEGNNGRIVLKATQASWVQITDVHQKVVYRKVLRPGDRYVVPKKKGLSLVTANAGGLDIFVDGKKVHPLGGDGEIVRGIQLNANKLKRKSSR